MDLRKLKTLIDLVSESNISELEITEAEGKVRIVKGGGYREPENTQAVLAALRARLGDGMQIDLRFCQLEELERNPVGKIRQCFNRLSPEDLARVNIPVSWGLHMAGAGG